MADLEALTRLQNRGSATGAEPIKLDVTGLLLPDDLLQRSHVYEERRRQLRELLDAVDSRVDDVQEHIAERVRADYRRRLDRLDEDFKPVREVLVTHLRSITFSELDLRQRLKEVEDELEELTFRSQLGEMNQVQLERASGAAEELRAELEVKLSLVEGSLASLARALDDLDELKERFAAEAMPVTDETIEKPPEIPETPRPPLQDIAAAPDAQTMQFTSPPGEQGPLMVAEEEALLPPEPAWLSRTENGVVDTYRLEGAVFTLGRSRSNDAVIRGASVSRLHAVIRWLGDAFVIEDTSSGGGIKVNGEKVTRRKLVDGDKIRLEAAYFEFISPP